VYNILLSIGKKYSTYGKHKNPVPSAALKSIIIPLMSERLSFLNKTPIIEMFRINNTRQNSNNN